MRTDTFAIKTYAKMKIWFPRNRVQLVKEAILFDIVDKRTLLASESCPALCLKHLSLVTRDRWLKDIKSV